MILSFSPELTNYVGIQKKKITQVTKWKKTDSCYINLTLLLFKHFFDKGASVNLLTNQKMVFSRNN